MSEINRLYNCKNPHQGDYKRVLCVCSAGLLRSPTAAFVLSNEPFNFNTRAAGLDESHALIPVDDVLLEWADEIVCMNSHQKKMLADKTGKTIINLDIPDNFAYRDSRLMRMIVGNYNAAIKRSDDEKTTDNEAPSNPTAENVHPIESQDSPTD